MAGWRAGLSVCSTTHAENQHHRPQTGRHVLRHRRDKKLLRKILHARNLCKKEMLLRSVGGNWIVWERGMNNLHMRNCAQLLLKLVCATVSNKKQVSQKQLIHN